MTDHIISPDGKLMWTGSEWIPAPPTPTTQSANVSMQDSVVGRDVNITNTTNITQSNAEDIVAVVVSTLEQLGFSGKTSPAELTPSQKAEVEQVLEISERLTSHGIEIDAWAELSLGNAARLARITNSAERHYFVALGTFRKNGNEIGEAWALRALGKMAKELGEYAEAERWYQKSLDKDRFTGIGASALNDLGNIAEIRGDLEEAERLYLKGLARAKNVKLWMVMEGSLRNLYDLAETRGDQEEAHRWHTESVRLKQQHAEESKKMEDLLKESR
jgi:tetratricopeptide (TPR) repeat protein